MCSIPALCSWHTRAQFSTRAGQCELLSSVSSLSSSLSLLTSLMEGLMNAPVDCILPWRLEDFFAALRANSVPYPI